MSTDVFQNYYKVLRTKLDHILSPKNPFFDELYYDGYPLLLLSIKNDIAAFATLKGDITTVYEKSYKQFKKLYAEKSREWATRMLSFVVFCVICLELSLPISRSK